MTKIMRKMKQCTALILAFAMVMTGGSFQGISFESKAATVSYTLAENMTGTVTANEEYEGVYSGTLAFTIPSEYNTKEKWDAAGINSFEVVFAVSSYQGVTGDATKVPGAQTLAMSDAWTWNSGSYANLTTEGTMTSIMDCAKMDWGGSNTLGKIGVQFTNLVGGSEVSYTIISAKLTGTGEPSTGSGPSGNTTAVNPGEVVSNWDVTNENVVLSLTGGDMSGYSEYFYKVTNKGSSATPAGNIKIKFNKNVTKHWFKVTSATVSGSEFTFPIPSIAAGSSYNTDLQFQFGETGLSMECVYFNSDTITVVDGTVKPQYDITSTECKYTPFEMHGKLTLDGTDIVDKNGRKTQLRGVSTHGIQYDGGNYAKYVNLDAMRQLRDGFGVNMIRIAAYVKNTDSGGAGYIDGNATLMDQTIQNAVTYANTLGMYVLIDWHILGDGNPASSDQMNGAKVFFEKYSKMYQNDDHVLYEICNEPNGGTTWSTIKAYAKEIISIIRKNDPEGLICVGTPNYSAEPNTVIGNEVDQPYNVLYSLHFYAGESAHKAYRDRIRSALNNGIPVFITEYGLTGASGDSNIDAGIEDSANWIALSEEKNLSMALWNLSNDGQQSAMFNKAKYNNWTASDLKTTGIWCANTYGKLAAKELEEYEAYIGAGTEKEELAADAISFPTAGNLTFGDSLKASTLAGGTTEYGTFAWKDDTVKPSVGTTLYDMVFTPSKEALQQYDFSKVTDYDAVKKTITKKVSVTTKKAEYTGTITFPLASAIKGGEALAASMLTGGTKELGSYAWADDTVVPSTGTYDVVLTLSDTSVESYDFTKVAGYNKTNNTIVRKVSVTVEKTKTTITKLPTASSIVYGQELSASILTGGTASVTGKFQWKAASMVLDAGEQSQIVEFIPTNSNLYDVATATVSVKVNKAQQEKLDKPVIQGIAATSITLQKVDGAEYGILTDGETNYQDSNVFTGLTELTEYTFVVRKKATANYDAGKVSDVTKGTTIAVPKYNIDLSKLGQESYIESLGNSVTYEAESNTITLQTDKKEYHISGVGEGVNINVAPTLSETTLDLTDGTTFAGINTSTTGEMSMTIKVDGTVTIAAAQQNAIIANDKTTLSVEGEVGAKLILSAGNQAAGIGTPADVTIKDIAITINAGTGIQAGTITITNSKVSVTATNGDGIAIDGDCNIQSDSEVTATASKNGIVSENGSVIMNQSKVTANGELSDISAKTDIVINESKVSADNLSKTPVNGEGNTIYTVAYEAGGGTGTLPELEYVQAGSKYQVAMINGLTNGEKQFAGWSDGTKVYAPGSSMIFPEKNVVFVAQWKESAAVLSFSVENIVLDSVTYGYEESKSVTVTVSNLGNAEATGVTATLLESDFEFTKTIAETIQPGEDSTFTVCLKPGLDAGKYVDTIQITSDDEAVGGAVGITENVLRSENSQIPNKPVLDGTPTKNSITLKKVAGCEYAMVVDGEIGTYIAEPVFTKLTENTEYTFVCRYAQTKNQKASKESAVLVVSTLGNYAWNVEVTKEIENDLKENYTSSETMEITIENTGTSTISGIKAILEGTDFVVTTKGTGNLDDELLAGEKRIIIVKLVTGKEAGNYTDTISISANNLVAKKVSISQKVITTGTSDTVKWSISKQTNNMSTSLPVGYAKGNEYKVEITNMGESEIVHIAASFEEKENSAFEIEGIKTTLLPGEKMTAVIRLKNGKSANTYKDTLTITSGNATALTVSLSQVVRSVTEGQGSSGELGESTTSNPAVATTNMPATTEQSSNKEGTIKNSTLQKNSDVIQKGKKTQILASSGHSIVSCVSDNAKVATVSATGKVKGKKKGIANITVTLDDRNILIFTVKVQNVKVYKAGQKITLKKGKMAVIKAGLDPVGVYANKGLSYKFSKKKIVSISKLGVVKGKKKGTVKVKIYLNKKIVGTSKIVVK